MAAIAANVPIVQLEEAAPKQASEHIIASISTGGVQCSPTDHWIQSYSILFGSTRQHQQTVLLVNAPLFHLVWFGLDSVASWLTV